MPKRAALNRLTSMFAGNRRGRACVLKNCRGLQWRSKGRSVISRTATKQRRSFSGTAIKTPTNKKQNTSTACCAKHGSELWKKFYWAGSWNGIDQAFKRRDSPHSPTLRIQTAKRLKRR